MRNALMCLGMLAVGCRANVPERCGDNPPCAEPNTVCVVADGGGTCQCAAGWDPASWGGCLPAFGRLDVDGRSVLSGVPTNEATFLVVDLPATAVQITVGAAAAATNASVAINGVAGTDAVLPFQSPLTVVHLTIVRANGELLRSLDLWVRRAPSYRVVGRMSGGVSGGSVVGAVALAADAPLAVVGNSSVGQTNWGVFAVAIGDGGLSPTVLVNDPLECPGWTVSVSASGAEVATSDCGSRWARFFSLSGPGWSEEAVSRPSSTVKAVALAPRGSVAWAAGQSLVAYERDGGSWTPRLVMTGRDGGSAVATDEDGTLAAWGRELENAVDVIGLDGAVMTTVRAPAELASDARFGASVALSGDGTVLAASTPTPAVPLAFLYEQADGGYQAGLRVESPRGRVFPTNSGSQGVTTAVALSLDGQTAAFGFPYDEAVVVARRADAGWTVQDVLFSGEVFGGMALFGDAVSLSRDGRRLGVACPYCSSGLVVFERGP